MSTATAPFATFHWNTGRMYASDGQRISARVWPGKIEFSDHSRGIDGLILLAAYAPMLSAYDIQRLVMTNYDHGNYSFNQVSVPWEAPKT